MLPNELRAALVGKGIIKGPAQNYRRASGSFNRFSLRGTGEALSKRPGGGVSSSSKVGGLLDLFSPRLLGTDYSGG
jgi:hypothetical protein